MENFKCILDIVEGVVKTLAFFAAASFFGWKIWSGYLLSNLSIQIELERKNKSADIDYLLINIKLNKGDRESVILKTVQLTVNNSQVIKLSSPALPDNSRMIRLPPGESTQFSHVTEINSNSVGYVEVYIDGYAGFF